MIIDGVWNHTGRDFWAFRDIRENGEASRFKDWYKITGFSDEFEDGFDYEGWWGYKGLPEFTEVGEDLHPEVKAHIFAVTERWMAPDGDVSRGVDGWRLDVAEEVGHDFWRDWHAHVRSINPEAITVAEIWTDAAREFVTDDMFSIVMNYRWAYATHDFFINRKIGASEMAQRLNALLDDFPWEVNLAMQNLMDSHDTERLATMVVNSDKDYKEDSKIRSADNLYKVRKPTDDEWEVVRLIALFQYTWVGSPMVYYGTEAGMWGVDDPDDRKPMMWPEMEFDDEKNHPYGHERPVDPVAFDHGMYEWYSTLAGIRHSEPALQHGSVEFIMAEEGSEVFVFVRDDEAGNRVIVVINRSDEVAEVILDVDGHHVRDLISGSVFDAEDGSVSLQIGPVSGMIMKEE